MRYKGTLILFGLVVLLGIYLFLIELPSERAKQEAEREAQLMFHFKPEEARGLLLRYAKDGEERNILVEKDAQGAWRIVQPIEAEADRSEIDRLISSFSQMRAVRVVEENAQDLKTYGLDQPEVRVSLRLNDGEANLEFGHKAPVGGSVYAKKEGEAKVHLLYDYYKNDMTKTVTDLRKKEFFEFDPEAVRDVKLDYPDRSFHLTRQGAEWRIQEPVEARADADQVNGLLNALSRLRAEDFADSGREALLNRLPPPEVKVALKFSDEPAASSVLSIYRDSAENRQEETYYALTGGNKTIFQVESRVLAGLKKDAFALRDKHLLAFDPDRVMSIQVEKEPGEEMTFRRQDGQWSYNGEAMADEERNKLSALLRSLSGLKAIELVDENPKSLNPFGLHAPNFEIILFDGAGIPLANLLIGNKKDDLVYAKTGKAKPVYLIRDEVSQAVPKGFRSSTASQTRPGP